MRSLQLSYGIAFMSSDLSSLLLIFFHISIFFCYHPQELVETDGVSGSFHYLVADASRGDGDGRRSKKKNYEEVKKWGQSTPHTYLPEGAISSQQSCCQHYLLIIIFIIIIHFIPI